MIVEREEQEICNSRVDEVYYMGSPGIKFDIVLLLRIRERMASHICEGDR